MEASVTEPVTTAGATRVAAHRTMRRDPDINAPRKGHADLGCRVPIDIAVDEAGNVGRQGHTAGMSVFDEPAAIPRHMRPDRMAS